MTLSRTMSRLSKPARGARIPLKSLAFARARARNKAHSKLAKLFHDSGYSKAEIAEMLGKDPAQLTRWLGGPGNLTLDTISDIAFAIDGSFVDINFDKALDRPARNYSATYPQASAQTATSSSKSASNTNTVVLRALETTARRTEVSEERLEHSLETNRGN